MSACNWPFYQIKGRAQELGGQKFGRLRALSYEGVSTGRSTWYCLCDCGVFKIIAARDLLTGNTVSCGCRRRETGAESRRTHGMSRSPTYMSYQAMIARCYNQRQESYRKYGARGITVCDQWRNGFDSFFADMGERPVGKTLDRRNPFGHYEPGNCRWLTPTEQARNRRGHAAQAMLDKLIVDGVLTISSLAAAYDEMFALQ